MRGSRWYVIQVQVGREDIACRAVERVSREVSVANPDERPLQVECFSPRYITKQKFRGHFEEQRRLLLPGYVIAVTNEPARLAVAMHGTREFTRLLTAGEAFVPLSEEDRSWIDRWTKEGDRTIPMSVAYKEGDKIVVTSGPLAGNEAMIARVNRRKCLAFLEIHIGAITVQTTIGLAILPESLREQAERGET